MNLIPIVASALLLSANVYAIYSDEFDFDADQKILHCVNSSGYSNALIQYHFNNKIYPLAILHNPQTQLLWNYGLMFPESWPLAIVGNLPLQLVSHLQYLIPQLQDDERCYFDVKEVGAISPEFLVSLRPIWLALKVDDPICDDLIQQAFESEDFVNQVFHYLLEDNYYKVRIIHNPKGLTFSSVRKYQLESWMDAKEYRISWSHKYGIIVDYEAPKALIDHLSKLTDASCWDWYFNFKIFNGTYAECKSGDYVYTLDTMFDLTQDLRVNQ